LGPACAANVLTIVAAAPDLGERGFELINKIGLDIAYGADGREGARSALATAADGGRATSR
jgi:hypothetical protein